MRDHPPPSFDIRGSGRSFFVTHDGQTVGGPYTSHGNAISALGGIERRLFPSTAGLRICRACKSSFLSIGERNCLACRAHKKGERDG